MSCTGCDNKPYTITHALDLDVDDLATPVDYFIGVRVVEDTVNETSIATPVRIPGAKVLPTGNLANVAAITTNNSSLHVPANQVRGGYIDIQPGGNVMKLSSVAHPPMFLMIGDYVGGKMLIQTTGFILIKEGHQYLVGRQYYDDGAGVPTTDSSTGIKLFRPLDEFTINVNGEF